MPFSFDVLAVLQNFHNWCDLAAGDRHLLDLALEESRRRRDLIESLQDFIRMASEKKIIMDVHASLDSAEGDQGLSGLRGRAAEGQGHSQPD